MKKASNLEIIIITNYHTNGQNRVKEMKLIIELSHVTINVSNKTLDVKYFIASYSEAIILRGKINSEIMRNKKYGISNAK